MGGFFATKAKAFGAAFGVAVINGLALAAIAGWEAVTGTVIDPGTKTWVLGLATTAGGWLGAFFAPKNVA